jgi:hypothetical protein
LLATYYRPRAEAIIQVDQLLNSNKHLPDRLVMKTDAQCEGRWASWVGGPLARSVCPVASNPVGDLVHAGFELL